MDIIIIICHIVIVIFTIALICSSVMLKKNDVTCAHHIRLSRAIRDYHIQCIYAGEDILVDYDDMEDYDRTLFRIWDWGYTKILPEEKFEIIKPFIKE